MTWGLENRIEISDETENAKLTKEKEDIGEGESKIKE